MDTDNDPAWSMLVVAAEVVTALYLHRRAAHLVPGSTDSLAEIRVEDDPRWGFVVGRCGWSTYLDSPTATEPHVSIAVPGDVDALDVDAPPSEVAFLIGRQLQRGEPTTGGYPAPARIDRPRRRTNRLHPGPAASVERSHPAGRLLCAVDARVIVVDWRRDRD